MSGDLRSLAAFAATLADASGPIVRRYFRTALNVDAKADESPVTIADREAEAALRARIEAAFPDHGIVGEEYGTVREDASHLWVLDPIDGTKAFVTGMPIFGTLIALAIDGKPVIGIIDQPILGERWVGVAGTGTTFNGNPVRSAAGTDLSAASLYATHPDMFRERDDVARFTALGGAAGLVRYGGDCYSYGLLASGHIDLVVEAQLQLYDFMALIPVVEGAGGTVSDWQGAPLGRGSDGHMLAAANATLRDAALGYLKR